MNIDFDTYLAGRSLTRAAAALNRDGHRTPTGLAWNKESLGAYLRRRRPKGARRPAPDYARAARLIEEGMPATWVAEDIHVGKKTIRDRFHGAPSRDRAIDEWRRVWPYIRTNPTLLALHYEFAPHK